MNLLHAKRLEEARGAFEAAIRDEHAGTGGELCLLAVLDRLDDHQAALELADALSLRGVKSQTIDDAIERALAKIPSVGWLIVSSDMTFAELARSLGKMWTMTASSGDAEPAAATWRARAGLIEYVRDPELDFRTLELFATPSTCRAMIDDIVNGAYVSTIDYQIGDYLRARTTRKLLYGLRAAEWRGRGPDHAYYIERVGTLRAHRDKRVAAEANRVYQVLEREAGRPAKTKARAARRR
jgi:hypothetical protein